MNVYCKPLVETKPGRLILTACLEGGPKVIPLLQIKNTAFTRVMSGYEIMLQEYYYDKKSGDWFAFERYSVAERSCLLDLWGCRDRVDIELTLLNSEK